MTTHRLGEEGFRWFIGIVEDRDDPLKLGRVKVRIVNLHSEKQSRIGTQELPWATILNSPNSASFNKVGISPTGMLVGSTVVGFFMDGNDGNNPVIMGTLAGIPGNVINNHDVSFEAREVNSINKELLGPEPPSAYKSKYPYNKVLSTERGHFIEIDDTPGGERLHIYHNSGTYVEIDPEGRLVTKIAGSGYEVIVKDKEVYVGGNANITVKGNVNLQVDGNAALKVNGNMSTDVGGTYSVKSGGNMSFNAPKIDLN